MTIPDKRQRLKEILRRLSLAPPASDGASALRLLGSIIGRVEDELTTFPDAPDGWADDGRLYPPQDDNLRSVAGRNDLVRYRNRGHNTYIRTNGAIEIRTLDGEIVFQKAGGDGKGVELAQ